VKLGRKAARPPHIFDRPRVGFVIALIATAGSALGFVTHNFDRETDDMKSRIAALEAVVRNCKPPR
jgi:hypothetical protein